MIQFTAVFTQYPFKPSNIPPQSPAKDFFPNLGSLKENKFASLEERIESIENKIKEQYEEVIGVIQNIGKTAESSLDLAISNSTLIAENTEKILSNEFEYQTLLEILQSQETENKKNQGGARGF